MRLAQVSQQLIGNQLTEPVYTEHGSLLVQQGTMVNQAIVDKLLNHNVNMVHVIDAVRMDIAMEPIVPRQQIDSAVALVQEVFEDVLHQDNLGVKAVIPHEKFEMVKEIIEGLMEVLMSTHDILYAVVDLISADAYTHRHSVNVAVLSILTAKAMGYKQGEIRDIALGGLLHDIGKARVNQNIIQKPSKLTNEERFIVERHPELGYEMVHQIETLPYITKQVVYLHHEKLDGTGYPLGLKGIEIPEYVQIVTVCDMYDAMTTNRIYRDKMPVYQALDILLAECIFRISNKILRHLIDAIYLYAPGSGVILSDGRVGIVSSYNIASPSRPRVRLLNLEAVLLSNEVQEIDLQKNMTLFIVDVWDVEDFKRGYKYRKQLSSEINMNKQIR